MSYKLHVRGIFLATLLGAGALGAASAPAYAAAPQRASGPRVEIVAHHVVVHLQDGPVTLRLVRGNVLQVHYTPGGTSTPASLVMAPHPPRIAADTVTVHRKHGHVILAGRAIRADLDTRTLALSVSDPQQHKALVTQANLAALTHKSLTLTYASGAPIYGVHGFNAFQHVDAKLLRHGKAEAKAGHQGNAGAPFAWSTRGFGVLVDTKGALFDIGKGTLSVSKTSRPDLRYDVIVGTPNAIFAALADLSGHAQLFPKWAMGFTNSQWGIDEAELKSIVKTYRSKHIPIDNFTLDFDWKAWGEDHYGEFRWNPQKFPDGPSGKLARTLGAEGMQLTGIMKPRIHVDTVEGHYATAHHLWVPGEKASKDYFSHKLVKDVDFDKQATRTWFGNLAMTYGFDKGIVGWWNDEADEIHDATQFLNMQRALYNAQRRVSDVRVWSVNRNFWLGSQRYAYGLWSGDIKTGFDVMAAQRKRMLSAIDVGEMKWGMDGGGFHGHPSDQNYARWIEFGAFTPIFRVHGDHGEKRQPWRYGAVAEKAATRAIRLRYKLLPYVYSYAWRDHAHGVGLVTPLMFTWPHDAKVANDVDAWMFGDWLLASPVVKKDQTEKTIYLPPGTWTDYFSGKVYKGGRSVTVATHAKTWDDIPLFIRQGAIIPTQKVLDYVGQQPIRTVTVDVFPAHRRTQFDYYDDGGSTYAYEHGAYFLQTLTTQAGHGTVTFTTGAPRGGYHPPLRHYLVKVHGTAARAVLRDGKALASAKSLQALRHGDAARWYQGHDRYGAVTYIKLPAGVKSRITLTGGQAPAH